MKNGKDLSKRFDILQTHKNDIHFKKRLYNVRFEERLLPRKERNSQHIFQWHRLLCMFGSRKKYFNRRKLLVRRESCYPEMVKNHRKINISMMFSGAADGTLLSPYTVYKAKFLWTMERRWTKRQEVHTYSSSQWFDELAFEEWLFSICIHFLYRNLGRKR